MPRQPSLLSFFQKGAPSSQAVPYAQLKEQGNKPAAEQAWSAAKVPGKTIDGIVQRLRKPCRQAPQQPLVPGSKRVREDPPLQASCINSSKRMKLLEALGADGDLKQGSWAEAQAKFEWLQPQHIRDGQGRDRSHPLFDRRTVKIPPEVLNKMSPSQKQYWATKCQYMDVLLFFKVGKFYELYELDAEIGHKELDWKMTVSGVGKCRQVGVPESGIEDAIQKLVARGYKVGRMEQTETSQQARAARGANAMVERKLVQVLSPSTLTEGIVKPDAIHLLAIKEEARTCQSKSTFSCGFSFIDAAAGRFYIGSFTDDASHSALESLLMQVAPQELLYEIGGLSAETLKVIQRYSPPGLLPMFLTPLQKDSEFLNSESALKMISSQGYFQGELSVRWCDLSGSITDKENAARALAALLSHLQRMKMDDELPSAVLCLYELYGGSLRLDGHTISNLELLENAANGSKAGTLIGFLDNCTTAFGKRLLRRWICHPLRDIRTINDRLDAVEELASNQELACSLQEHLRRLPDMERLLARTRTVSGTFNTLPFASKGFQRMLKVLCSTVQGMRRAYDALECLEKAGVRTSLLQAAYRTRASKPSANESLSTIEAQIDVETVSLVEQDCDEEATLSWLLAEFNQHGVHWASVIIDVLASLDVLLAFSYVSKTSEGPTCRPRFAGTDDAALHIKGLWHPFAKTSAGSMFVRNDVSLGLATAPAMLLTGPNMGGKSTLLRAACLTALMAQLGCFVPAESCTLSPVDTIFTRIGARDRIISGESTFMVECREAASILHHATGHSLVVLDELGRGTSTFDGYAVAYAVFRHLVDVVHCRLLFATHYHPLAQELVGKPGVSLQHMACQYAGEQLVFLYKLSPGACPSSYGLQVALLAGLPGSVIQAASRAREMLTQQQVMALVQEASGGSHGKLVSLWHNLANRVL